MAQRFSNFRSILISLLVVLILALGLTQPASAGMIIYGDTVAEGTEVDQNLILTGYNVNIDGTVNGDVMAFGTRVTINGTVNGDVVTAAEYVNINGQVTGNVYSTALLLNLDTGATITRDLLFLGVQLNMQNGSTIERDLQTLSLLSASFAGKVNRSTFAEIGPSAILQLIFNLAGWPLPNWLGSGSLTPDQAPQHYAQVPFLPVSASTGILSGAGLYLLSPASLSAEGNQAGYLLTPVLQLDPEWWSDWGLGLLRNLAALLLVGLFALWLARGTLDRSSERLRMAPWASVGWGLVVYLVGWFLFGMLFTLILALAIFFFTVTFVKVGFLVGGVGLTVLGLAFALFCVSVFYLSKIVVGFWFGRLLLRLASKKVATGRIVPLLLGVVLYALLASVPYLGFVVATVATFFGLGAIWMAVRPVKQLSHAITPVEQTPSVPVIAEEPAVASLAEPAVGRDEAALSVEEVDDDLSDELNIKTMPLEETPVSNSPAAAQPEPVEKLET